MASCTSPSCEQDRLSVPARTPPADRPGPCSQWCGPCLTSWLFGCNGQGLGGGGIGLADVARPVGFASLRSSNGRSVSISDRSAGTVRKGSHFRAWDAFTEKWAPRAAASSVSTGLPSLQCRIAACGPTSRSSRARGRLLDSSGQIRGVWGRSRLRRRGPAEAGRRDPAVSVRVAWPGSIENRTNGCIRSEGGTRFGWVVAASSGG